MTTNLTTPEVLSPIQQKAALLQKELDTAFHAYMAHQGQSFTLRGWSITISLAYVGFLISLKTSSLLATLPFASMLALFALLEAKEREAMRFDSREVRRVERIFMISDPAQFTAAVCEYEFRDLRIRNSNPFNYSIAGLWKHIATKQTLAWYSPQLTIVFLVNLLNYWHRL